MDKQKDGLYFVLISVHGLIRGGELELGHDADTGGQTKYVVELARALADHPDVARVDLVTRRIQDANLSADYAQPVETLADKARIVRLPCGPPEYVRKESLWPYLDSFADHLWQHLQGAEKLPDLIHAHYADAGYVGARVAGMLGLPLVYTGHSLGRVKRERLLEQGFDIKDIEQQYTIDQRIEAEEQALDAAALVVTSTQQEVDEQYALYQAHQEKRCKVIPPGVDLSCFHPPRRGEAEPPIKNELRRFLKDVDKPMILALSRADERKNIGTLVQAYAEHPQLRKRANLVVVAGKREDIAEMEQGPRDVLTDLLLEIDRQDLYGSIAYPPQHTPDDVPDLYRLAAKTRGVFVNPALTEPFGLTLIEAAASGLPVVATQDGGPRDILKFCKHGLLIDPLDGPAMAEALYDALTDRDRWQRWSKNAVRGATTHYSWSGHVKTYLKAVNSLLRKTAAPSKPHGLHKPSAALDRLLISDIDNTLLGDADGLRALWERLQDSGQRVGFAVATGRRLESALKILDAWGLPVPDVLITAVGSEIHYGPDLKEDAHWHQLINFRWKLQALRWAMKAIPGLRLQAASEQRRYKISYNVNPGRLPPLAEIQSHLRKLDLHAKLIYSHQAYLDLLPLRASKGFAVRYLARQWSLPLNHLLVAGDSGNDEEMLRGNTLGVVVGNHSPELASLRGQPQVYFAKADYARGILEGCEHYGFLAPSGDLKNGDT